MRIGIDCLNIKANYRGGINSYTLGLLNGFKSIDSDNEYIIFCTDKNKELFEKYNQGNFKLIVINDFIMVLNKYIMLFPLIINSVKFWKFINDSYYRILGIKKLIETNCDILYISTTVLNIFNLQIPTILSMHDIQHHHYPEFFSKIRLKWRRLTFKNSAKYASYFQASSNFIKEDLLSIFHEIDEKQIVVIPEGVNIEEFTKKREIDLFKKFNISEEFIFFPAQLWKHKNHITVLKALKKLEQEGVVVPLIMTGDKYSASQEILDFMQNNNMFYVKYLGKVKFQDLVALYQQAKFMITATMYESSSLPILESAASGTAIIAAKTPPNIEMAKNIKMHLFEPLDIKECASVIKKCWLSDKTKIDQEVADNKINVKIYSWNKIASQYLSFIKEKIDVK